MEGKIKKMYLQDCSVIFLAMATLWSILTFVMTKVTTLAPNHMVRIIIILVVTVVGAFTTASAIAVLMHLKRNQRSLYLEELLSYEDNRKDS